MNAIKKISLYLFGLLTVLTLSGCVTPGPNGAQTTSFGQAITTLAPVVGGEAGQKVRYFGQAIAQQEEMARRQQLAQEREARRAEQRLEAERQREAHQRWLASLSPQERLEYEKEVQRRRRAQSEATARVVGGFFEALTTPDVYIVR